MSASVWTTDGTDSLFARLEKLEFENVAINQDGSITLASDLTEKAAPGDNAVWCACRDRSGNVYFGTGSSARLYRLNRGAGKPELIHDGGTGEIMALTADVQGNVYFAATPEAKVYRIRPGAKPELLFETLEKYVFNLLPASDGTVYCATGEHGKLYRIPADGKGIEVFAAPQAHIATLAWLVPDKKLLAGTSPDGIVYLLDLTGTEPRPKATVLYDTPLDEVRSILVDRDHVYIGANPSGDAGADSAGPRVYGVDTDGTLNWSWHVPDSTLFAMSLSSHSTTRPLDHWTTSSLLVATGNRGLIYSLDTLGRASVRHKAAESQALCLLLTAEGIWLGTGNSARLYLAGKGLARSGSFESPAFDCQNPARFGRFGSRASVPMGTALAFDTRTGNSEKPDSTWRAWQPVSGNVVSEPSRYVQWRARLSSEFPDRTPTLERVDLYYTIANRPPAIKKLDVAALPMDDARKGAAKTTRAVTWEATDPDADSLRYELFFRREGETSWQRVAKDVTDSKFELDTRALADGWYELRLVASDRFDRIEQYSLSTELITRPFLVDNTAPTISDLRVSARRSGSPSPSTPRTLDPLNPSVAVSFTATDVLSPIVSCRVTTNAGDWQPAEPIDALFDSLTERFSVEIPAQPGPGTIAVWVADAQGNVGSARTQTR